MFEYGALLRRAFDTSGSKLPLAADVLSRQLHYVTDGGSLLNYCDYWPACPLLPTHCAARVLQNP